MPEQAPEEPEQEYRYNPEGKPDPFRSFVRVSLRDDPGGISSPLERFDLSQLTVTGIIWGPEVPRALIEDPAGKGYIVSVGTSIGKNKGKVVSIDDNLVLVKETYVDFRDRATTKEVELHLYETQGG
jgi:type IV pilus assembly protein PilP